MSRVRFPDPLRAGGTIAVTAPSSGVLSIHKPRLDLAIKNVRALGFDVVEGHCLHGDVKHVSASAEQRASEFFSFWCDPSVRAIIPPWGGELLINILPKLNFSALKTRDPVWLLGYSDISTLSFAITTMTDVATAHGTNLMDTVPGQVDGLSERSLEILSLEEGQSVVQESSDRYQVAWTDFVADPASTFHLTEETRVSSLDGANHRFTGRMIGGCLDVLLNLVGTPFGDLPSFSRRHSKEGLILYFENCELSPCALARALWNMRLASWFQGVNGVVFGRSDGPSERQAGDLTYVEAISDAIGDLDIPVILDADIGHRPPQWTIINGSLAEVEFKTDHAVLKQSLRC